MYCIKFDKVWICLDLGSWFASTLMMSLASVEDNIENLQVCKFRSNHRSSSKKKRRAHSLSGCV